MASGSPIYVFDACAIIAFFRDEPGADAVREILAEPSNRPLAHVINICEVCYDAMRREESHTAQELLSMLAAVGIEVCSDCSTDLWSQAAQLKARFRRISLADCFALALAIARNATLVTSDHHEFDPIAATGVCPIQFIR